MGEGGFEPTTSAVTGRRSNQLSHQAKPLLKALHIPSKPHIVHIFSSVLTSSAISDNLNQLG